MTALLEVGDLSVRYGGEVQALIGLGFSLDAGESLAVVGESGAGKSTLVRSLAGLVQAPEATGSVRLGGQQLLGAPPETLRSLRLERVALTLQGAPMNPVIAVGDQVAEPLRTRRRLSGARARRRAAELAEEVLLDPAALDRHPHQLSGGERQRAALAMALALDPELLVLDEPVSGLDPPARRELIDRIRALCAARGLAVVAVCHNLDDARRLTARTLVLYAGQAMELGPTESVVGNPRHPYSWALANAQPVMATTKDLRPIRGRPPDPRATPAGCPFHPRCTQAQDVCTRVRPGLEGTNGRLVACHRGGLLTLLEARDLRKSYGSGSSTVRALDGVSVTVRQGESLGVVGLSGSGKTTLARVVSAHLRPDAGTVLLAGEPLATGWRAGARSARRRVQLIAQDPWEALSPRLPVRELVREPLDLAGDDPRGRDAAVSETLEAVGLPGAGSFLRARVHELSGGQLQRIALARALLAAPLLLVADEPTSMLDPSEQARVLLVLRERQIEMGLGLVLISHELAVVRKVCDRIVVLDAGRVVEEGPSGVVASAPASDIGIRLMG